MFDFSFNFKDFILFFVLGCTGKNTKLFSANLLIIFIIFFSLILLSTFSAL